MCSCSGNCNCNSSTIPRGPQGPPGPTGATGIPGTAATITVGDVTSGTPAAVTNSGTSNAAVFDFTIPPGNSGTNGINAYSQVNTGFSQPVDNAARNIFVQNNTWMAPGQIIYIGPGNTSTDPGGYYKVNFLLGGSITGVNVTKLDWTDPNTIFVPPLGLVDAGARVTSAGVIGPEGKSGTSISNVQNPLSSVTTSAGTYSLKTLSLSANEICPTNGDIAKITFIAQAFSSGPPAGPNKPYFSIIVNGANTTIRPGTLLNNLIYLDISSTPVYATVELTIIRTSVTSANFFVKAFLDNTDTLSSQSIPYGGSNTIVNFASDQTTSIPIDFSSINIINFNITLPQSMSYTFLGAWVEKYLQ